MGGSSGTSLTMAKFVKQVEQIVATSPLVVFSKTTCGYCARAKSLLDNMKVSFNAVELDRIADGRNVQRSQGDDGTVNGSEHLHQGQEHWWLRRHHVPPR